MKIIMSVFEQELKTAVLMTREKGKVHFKYKASCSARRSKNMIRSKRTGARYRRLLANIDKIKRKIN